MNQPLQNNRVENKNVSVEFKGVDDVNCETPNDVNNTDMRLQYDQTLAQSRRASINIENAPNNTEVDDFVMSSSEPQSRPHEY